MLPVLCGGCATIVHGNSQYVQIDSIPPGAQAFVDGVYITTPGKVLLKRGYPTQEHQIVVQKEGYKPAYATISQTLSGWLWGDLFWGILPGITVDIVTGAAFNLYPSKVTITLEPSAK